MIIVDRIHGEVVREVRALDRGRALHLALGACVVSQRMTLDPVSWEIEPA